MTRRKTLKRVLVLAKKSRYTIMQEQNDKHNLRLVARKHHSVADVLPAHEEHEATMACIVRVLKTANADVVMTNFDTFLHMPSQRDNVHKFDLVLSVGGDGTVLGTSHYVKHTHVLGVNSSPSTSHGKYCLAKADNLAQLIDEIRAGTLKPERVLRLRTQIGQRLQPVLALNEMLIRDADDGGLETSRYQLKIGDVSEFQMSSGVMIGTAGGSTGWMHSSGSDVLHLNSQHYQYLVRELIVRPNSNPRLRRGVLPPGSKVQLVSHMMDSWVFIDGKHVRYKLPRGATLTVRPGTPLKLYINTDANRAYAKDMVPTFTGWTPRAQVAGSGGPWH